jgi:hypothetical protein
VEPDRRGVRRQGLRSATQCAGRYQAHLNQDLIQSAWTTADDDLLRQFVSQHGIGRWSEAVLQLPGHTHAQALHRWDKVLKPGRRKGTWLKEEDDALRFAVAAYAHVNRRGGGRRTSTDGTSTAAPENGNDEGHTAFAGLGALSVAIKAGDEVVLPWSKIAAHVATRSDVQCRERWINVLDPALVKAVDTIWHKKEEDALRAAVTEFTVNADGGGVSFIAWSHVARRIGRNLTGRACRDRYKMFLRADKIAAAAVAPKRKADMTRKRDKAEPSPTSAKRSKTNPTKPHGQKPKRTGGGKPISLPRAQA